MHTRTRTVVLLAILLAVSGCVSAPSAGNSAEPSFEGTAVATAHASALETAGSYTYSVEANATVDGQAAGDSKLRAAVDLSANRSTVESSSDYGPIETYVSNGTVYQRIGAENPRYRTLDVTFGAEDVVSTDVGPLVRNHTFVSNGTTTVDGSAVQRYETHATGSNATLQQDFGDGVSVETLDVTLGVRDDGVVVRQHTTAELAFETENVTGTYTRTVTYTDVGSTSVPRPDWIDDAVNATDSDA